MLALKISDIKDFMNKLLIGEVFDHFSFAEASITTFNTFTIDGLLQHDFLDTDTNAVLQEKSVKYSLWHDVKSYCFSIDTLLPLSYLPLHLYYKFSLFSFSFIIILILYILSLFHHNFF